jgi:hypothetical protein
MADRRWRLAIAVLSVLGGTALVLDWTARDPSRERPDREATAEPSTPVIAIREAPELPSEGSVRVETTRDGLTIRANQARRSSILESLGRAGGFSVEGTIDEDPRLRLILKVNDLRTAVVAILGNADHTIHYDGPPENDASSLTRVVLGRHRSDRAEEIDASRRSGDSSVAALDARDHDHGNSTGDSSIGTRPNRAPTPSELSQVERKRARLLEAQRLEDLALIAEGDESGRAGAVARLDVDDRDSLDALAKSVKSDPSSRVRMRAARRLGFGDSTRVLPVLTTALSDPDPDVVVEVVEAIALVGEAESIPSLEALREHESPAVREVVDDAIAVLR